MRGLASFQEVCLNEDMKDEFEAGSGKLSSKGQETLCFRIIYVEENNLRSNVDVRANMVAEIREYSASRVSYTWKRYRESDAFELGIEFLRRLVAGMVRIHLILDNMKVHNAKRVQEWLGMPQDEFKLFFLTPYAPQHNPDEYLNGNFKREFAGSGYSKTLDGLESKARAAIERFLEWQNSHRKFLPSGTNKIRFMKMQVNSGSNEIFPC
jgi:hypothetical protein